MDWHGWHHEYDRPGSALAARLDTVRARLRLALDEAPPGPLRVISLCAGQGRDVLGVLPDHPRRKDVRALLVELDPENTAAARSAAESAGLLRQVEIVTGDAALTDHYGRMAPADIVLVCGVFGNIADEDIRRTVGFCPQLCAPGGTVIWTRHRGDPDRVPLIRRWFEELDFERVWISERHLGWGVGVHRYRGKPVPLEPGERLFTFVGYNRFTR